MKLIAIMALFSTSAIAQMPGIPADQATKPISLVSANAIADPVVMITQSPRLTGEAKRGHTFYRWSVTALIAANATDAASSWKHQEVNPLLGGSSTFGTRALAYKAGFTGASLLIEHFALKHRPEMRRKFAWLNLGIATALTIVSIQNFQIQ